MICWKFIFILAALTTATQADCPLSQNPKAVIECLRYITSGLYGAITKDLKIICNIASDIASCARRELGDCVAAEVGRKALDEVRDLAENCCPDRNHPRCPIRDSIIHDQRCFAADSLVTLANGQHKSIAHLQSHDILLAYSDKTKQIIPTHLLTMLDFQLHRFALFKQVTTTSGRQLSLTSSHLLPTNEHGYVMAKDLHIGMSIYVMSDEKVLRSETITNVTDVMKQGYVAPLTAEGTLIVNDVAASCYATINSHYVAHFAVAPMRWWYGVFGMSRKGCDEIEGVHWFAKMLYEITAYLVPSIIHKG
ncbi:hypothetical protein I4U23_030293 [Adineta vaga]|nr:hypothetical protein I4U23_030293 [Adineta vaga]